MTANPAMQIETGNSIKVHKEYVLIKPIEKEKASKSGLYIPDDGVKERARRGVIVDVGDALFIVVDGVDKAFRFNVGDIAYFKPYNADPIEINGEAFVVVKAEDIMITHSQTK